jgi:RNA polymerase sigma-70 factor (ECF subfamily)
MASLPDDETVLIAQARRGSLDAFNRLVLTHQDRVFNLAYRLMGDNQSASDVTQEVFITAFRRLSTFRGGSFRAWLLRIATNRCYDELRRNRRNPTTALDGEDPDQEPLQLPDIRLTPEETAIQRELQRAIQICINALGADQRLVLVLSDIEGLSYEEIAAQTGSQLGTVKSRLSRARAGVRDCLRGARELLPSHFRLKDQ